MKKKDVVRILDSVFFVDASSRDAAAAAGSRGYRRQSKNADYAWKADLAFPRHSACRLRSVRHQ